MRHFSYLTIALLAALVVTSGTSKAHASHIDQLGFSVSLFSSDGVGGFSVLFKEFLGSDGSSWNSGTGNWAGSFTSGPATAAGRVKSLSFSASMVGPGTLSPTGGSASLHFAGLVNSVGVPTAGFGTGQFGTRFVNGLSDASEWSAVVAFTISGFDSSASYTISVAGSDCCFVTGSGTPSFDEDIVFDPSIVVGPPGGGGTPAVPEPSSLVLLGIGACCLVGYRRKRRRANRDSQQV